MDIVREPPKKTRKYVAYGAVGAAVLAGTLALSKMEPAAPSVDRATLWVDTVRRGTMTREVRAPGTLVPEHVRIISAQTAGRVEQLIAQPGVPVTPTTPLLLVTNPDVNLQQLEADRQLGQAEQALASLRTQLEGQLLQQRGAAASATAEYQEAKRLADVAVELDRKGLGSKGELSRATERAEELRTRRDVETQRLALLERTMETEIGLARRNMEKLRGIAAFHRERLQAMAVTAGESGILQEMNLELGQWVVPGQMLARVAQPGKLKAELRVPETQARDVVVGQKVRIDTRTGDARAGVVEGRVLRVDPGVQNGTVEVEVSLVGALPKGARPDLSVDGTIEIERLDDVLYVGRPAYGQAESTVGLFRLEPDGTTARRVQVKLGRASVNTIEIVEGLAPGDRVIISDVSQWDAQERLRIK